MAPQLSCYIKQRIVNMAENGKSYTNISKIILAEDQLNVSRQAISAVYARYKQTGSFTSKRKSGKKKKLEIAHYDYIDECYENNDELTSVGKKK